jgi:ABC-type lipoprotein release transport system permease subunit
MDPWLALGSGLAIGVAVCIIGSAVMAIFQGKRGK